MHTSTEVTELAKWHCDRESRVCDMIRHRLFITPLSCWMQDRCLNWFWRMEGRALQLVEMSRSMTDWLILQSHTSIIFSFLDSYEVDDKSRNMWLYYGPRLNPSLQLRSTQRKRRHTGFPYCQIRVFSPLDHLFGHLPPPSSRTCAPHEW